MSILGPTRIVGTATLNNVVVEVKAPLSVGGNLVLQNATITIQSAIVTITGDLTMSADTKVSVDAKTRASVVVHGSAHFDGRLDITVDVKGTVHVRQTALC